MATTERESTFTTVTIFTERFVIFLAAGTAIIGLFIYISETGVRKTERTLRQLQVILQFNELCSDKAKVKDFIINSQDKKKLCDLANKVGKKQRTWGDVIATMNNTSPTAQIISQPDSQNPQRIYTFDNMNKKHEEKQEKANPENTQPTYDFEGMIKKHREQQEKVDPKKK